MNIKVFNIRLNEEFCQEDQNKMNEFLCTVKVKLTSASFVTSASVDFWSAVVFYEPKKESKPLVDLNELTVEEEKIYSALRQWRNDLAGRLGWSAFRICHNSHLTFIAKAKPQNLEELKQVKSFGETRTANYGDDIISLLNAL